MFGPNGIYSNPTQRGNQWEKPFPWNTSRATVRRIFKWTREFKFKEHFSVPILQVKSIPSGWSSKTFTAGNTRISPYLATLPPRNLTPSCCARRERRLFLERREFTEHTRAMSSAPIRRKKYWNIDPHGNYVQLYINGVYWGFTTRRNGPTKNSRPRILAALPISTLQFTAPAVRSKCKSAARAWTAMLAKSTQAGSSPAGVHELQ